MIETSLIEDSSIATNLPSGERPEVSRRLLICTPFPPRLDARHGGRATAQLLARLASGGGAGPGGHSGSSRACRRGPLTVGAAHSLHVLVLSPASFGRMLWSC